MNIWMQIEAIAPYSHLGIKNRQWNNYSLKHRCRNIKGHQTSINGYKSPIHMHDKMQNNWNTKTSYDNKWTVASMMCRCGRSNVLPILVNNKQISRVMLFFVIWNILDIRTKQVKYTSTFIILANLVKNGRNFRFHSFTWTYKKCMTKEFVNC